jgi:hypothetical protein
MFNLHITSVTNTRGNNYVRRMHSLIYVDPFKIELHTFIIACVTHTLKTVWTNSGLIKRYCTIGRLSLVELEAVL